METKISEFSRPGKQRQEREESGRQARKDTMPEFFDKILKMKAWNRRETQIWSPTETRFVAKRQAWCKSLFFFIIARTTEVFRLRLLKNVLSLRFKVTSHSNSQFRRSWHAIYSHACPSLIFRPSSVRKHVPPHPAITCGPHNTTAHDPNWLWMWAKCSERDFPFKDFGFFSFPNFSFFKSFWLSIFFVFSLLFSLDF